MAINDAMASLVLGELDKMTKTIDQTVTRLDDQIHHLRTIESKISERVSALIEHSTVDPQAPLNPQTAEFLRQEIRQIFIAARAARAANLDSISTAVTETLRSSLNTLENRGGTAFDAAAAQFQTEIGRSVAVASETANQTLKQICIDLNLKLQAMTSSAAKMQWAAMLGSSIIAAIVATILTVHLVK